MNPRNVDAIAEELFAELVGDDPSLVQARLKLEEMKLWTAKYAADLNAKRIPGWGAGTAKNAMRII